MTWPTLITTDGRDIFTLDMASEDNLSMKTSVKIMNSSMYNSLFGLGLHHQYMYNALQLNNGVNSPDQKPLFSDIGQMAGIPSTDWSWGPLVFDMDNDGLKDLHIANGILRDLINLDYIVYKSKRQPQFFGGEIDVNEYVTSVMASQPPRLKNDYFFRNKGDLTFEKVNNNWVEELPTASNGSAYADFDNDGDMDIVVNNSGGNSFIYKNLSREKETGNYIQFSLEGNEQNLLGIGTRIIIHQESQTQVLEQYLTRGFLSSVSPVLHAGMGKDTRIPVVEVIWPDGKKQVIKKVKTNRILTLAYKDAKIQHPFAYAEPGMFSDITKDLNLEHSHHENQFDDFRRESMLPHRMSSLGPALAVADVNGDGLEDFYIGGSSGYSGVIFLQDDNSGSPKFIRPTHQPWILEKKSEDIRASFFDADMDGDPDLYVISGSNESPEGLTHMRDRLYENTGNGKFRKSELALPDVRESGGCVVPGDYDGDGDLDLFIGGRQNPGQYPLPSSSRILRNDSKPGDLKFTDLTSEICTLSDRNWDGHRCLLERCGRFRFDRPDHSWRMDVPSGFA